MQNKNSGLVYVFTGEGKGKTSAALGVVTRALLLGERVVWVAFYKGTDWEIAEKKLGEKFGNLEMHFTGRGFRIEKPEQVVNQVKIASVGNGKVVDTASEEEHMSAASEGLVLAGVKLAEQPFLLVLDEVLNAVSEGLVESKGVMELLGKRGDTHIILTGRGATKDIIQAADLVTECKKIKHPYDAGKLAVRGLDF